MRLLLRMSYLTKTMAEKDGENSEQHEPASNANYLRSSSSSSSIFLNPWFVLSTVTLAFLLFFSLPPLLNFLTTLLRPKYTWISLNNCLLLFAIISGALRNHNDDHDYGTISAASQQIGFPSSSSSSSSSFLEHPIHQDPVRTAEMEFSSNPVCRLRNIKSYPDLTWEPKKEPQRYSLDILVNSTSTSRRRSAQMHRLCLRQRARAIQIAELLNWGKVSGSPQRIAEDDDLEKLQHPPLPPPSPPPPSPQSPRSEKNRRKKSRGAKDIARTLAHLYKKKIQKSKHNYETALRSPPPPPPRSVFYNLFKTSSSKRKSVHSMTHPPPPAPPLPLPLQLTKKALPPPAPASESFSDGEDDHHGLNIGSESPMIPLPPPPPPPFQLQRLKFRVRGGFVPVSSGLSDGSDSENDEIPTSGRKASRPFFPSVFRLSPQVDTRADSFIARFHEKLRMENMT